MIISRYEKKSQMFSVRRNVFFVSVSLFFLGISAVFAVRETGAFSTYPAISFEVAEYGLRIYTKKFQGAQKDSNSTLDSLGQCRNGVFRGNYFTAGEYEVRFFDEEHKKAGEQLRCNAKLSRVSFIRSRGLYRGMSTLVQWKIGATITSFMNGSCGTRSALYAESITAWPTSSSYCASGVASATPAFPDPGSSVSWVCNGTNGGSNSPLCQAIRSRNGQCNPTYNGKTLTSIPATGLCSVGTQSPAQVSGSSPWNWTCIGSNGGSTASCSASSESTVNGSCGSAATTYAWNASGFSGSFCSSGSVSPNPPSFPPQGGSSNWTCLGNNNGGNASCSATRLSSPVFSCSGSRPSNTAVYPGDDADVPANTSWAYSKDDTGRKCEYYCNAGFTWNGSVCTNVVDPLNPETNVLLLSSHFDDETIWFEPWLKIADKIMSPVMYPLTPYQETHIGLKYLNPASWVMPQGKLDNEMVAEYRAHDRMYRKSVLTDQYISSLVEDSVKATDVIVTHSPWGEYGHEQHRQLFCVAQALAMKYKKDLYIWNGMPDEMQQMAGMPVTYHLLTADDGSPLPFVRLPYSRAHYDSIRTIFRRAEVEYPKYHNGVDYPRYHTDDSPCNPETDNLCNYWSWDRTWNGSYGTYNPPTVARYYKMVDRGDPVYSVEQQRELLHMRPYYPNEDVFGRRDCLTNN